MLTAVSTRHPLTSSPACVAVTDELLRLHAYLQSLLETLQTARLALAPSPACAAKSSEEVAILLLDDMRCVDILNEEIALRLAPFCARRNMSVDEVLSYYVQRELETVGELDDRRVRVLWGARPVARAARGGAEGRGESAAALQRRADGDGGGVRGLRGCGRAC